MSHCPLYDCVFLSRHAVVVLPLNRAARQEYLLSRAIPETRIEQMPLHQVAEYNFIDIRNMFRIDESPPPLQSRAIVDR